MSQASLSPASRAQRRAGSSGPPEPPILQAWREGRHFRADWPTPPSPVSQKDLSGREAGKPPEAARGPGTLSSGTPSARRTGSGRRTRAAAAGFTCWLRRWSGPALSGVVPCDPDPRRGVARAQRRWGRMYGAPQVSSAAGSSAFPTGGGEGLRSRACSWGSEEGSALQPGAGAPVLGRASLRRVGHGRDSQGPEAKLPLPPTRFVFNLNLILVVSGQPGTRV